MPFFNTGKMDFRSRFGAQVFHVFDTLLPEHQFRHKIDEVSSWFVEEGLTPAFHAHSYYVATANVDSPAKQAAVAHSS